MEGNCRSEGKEEIEKEVIKKKGMNEGKKRK